MAPPLPELSVVVLCYRAGWEVTGILDPLYDQLSASPIAFELVLVANYWPAEHDPTPAAVAAFAQTHTRCRTVHREKGGAMGWDMRSGFEAARGEYLIVIDGDGQNPVTDVLRMYDLMRRGGFDLMKGRRVVRHDGFRRWLLSTIYNVSFLVLFRTVDLWDINAKPKGLTRSAYERLDLRSNDWFIDAEIVLEAQRNHFNVGEMNVIFLKNRERASFVGVRAISEFVVNMVRYRLRRV